jgi:hypothetical protein
VKPLDVLSALVLEDGTPWGIAADHAAWPRDSGRLIASQSAAFATH